MSQIGLIRFAIFVLVFAGFALLERRYPARRWRTAMQSRWLSHATLGGLSLIIPTIILRLVPILAAAGAARWAEGAQFGLLHWLSLPSLIAIPLAILLLDLAIYGQHRAMHRWPLLWRFHAVHHHDHDLDVTTALRFHPGEILLSTFYKAGAAALLGAPLIAVVIHETLLSTMAIFNHANIALPPRAERLILPILVTPTMHVRHHSIVRGEHDANYGNMLSIWDRLLGSYCPEPAFAGPLAIGLAETQTRNVTGLRWLIKRPFR
ncbi:MAG: sterol desaturase family protein [Sphingomonas sp.]|uniref:sterol desaturase family protein n=1 Tax=Sphingomonas sp. TaxID=28214 RepID=UPI0035A965F6|nr:sterol desaturase family protein [Sphingomonas sp.]